MQPATTLPARAITRKVLLLCGILSSLWYVAINIIVPLQDPNYNIVTQTVSELSAIDAPTRSLWVLLCVFYSLFVIAFGWGVWLSAAGNRKLDVIAFLLIAYGVSGFFWPPMHQREVIAAGRGSLTDTMHIAFAIGTVILMMLMIGFAMTAFGKSFRIFCILCFIIFLVFGFLTGLESPGISTNTSTPWIGVWERINIGVYLLWTIVFAINLLRYKK
jgi:hypothetical protein